MTACYYCRLTDLYIEKNGSTKKTAAQLNVEGVARRNGQPWNLRAVVTLVRCPRYVGLARADGGELIKGDQEPFNRRALIRALVRNVRVFETTIDITLDLTGLGVSPTDVPLPDAERDDAGNLIVRVPVKFSHVSGRKKIETSHPTEFQTDSPILKAVARAMAWLKMLDEGTVSSIHDLADTLKLERKYVRYTLRLAFLSPRVIRAIMQGQEPDGLSLASLRRLTTANWAEQEKFLGLQ